MQNKLGNLYQVGAALTLQGNKAFVIRGWSDPASNYVQQRKHAIRRAARAISDSTFLIDPGQSIFCATFYDIGCLIMHLASLLEEEEPEEHA